MNYSTIIAAVAQADVTPASALTISDLLLVGTIMITLFGIIQGIVKFGDRLWGKHEQKQRSDQRHLPSTLPTAYSPLPCTMAHEGLKQTMEHSFKSTNESLNRLAAGLDSFRDMVQRSHENILVNQKEIVTEIRSLKS